MKNKQKKQYINITYFLFLLSAPAFATSNVGIGTTSPGYLLDLVTNATVALRLNGTSGNASSNNTQLRFAGGKSGEMWAIGTDVAAGTGTKDFHFYDLTSGPKMTLQSSTGYVGIGTTSPGYPLQVNGTAAANWTVLGLGSYGVLGEANNASYVSVEGYNTATGAYGCLGNGTAGVTGTGTAANWAGIFTGAGTYGLDASNVNGYYSYVAYSSYGLYTNGSVYAPGGYTPSDARLKENVRDVENPLENLMRLHPVKFDWKKNSDAWNTGKRSTYGFIAQELEKVFPETVKDQVSLHQNAPKQDDSGSPLSARHGGKDNTKFSLNDELGTFKVASYNDLIAIVCAGVQDLWNRTHAFIQAQTSWNQHQEKIIAQLREETLERNSKISQLEQELRILQNYLCAKDKAAPGCQ